MKKFRKGFTIVELVIVIAVIAVLTAVLVPTFIHLASKSKETSDNSLVANLNNALAMDKAEGNPEPKTMQDAVDAVKRQGYFVPQLATKSEKKLVYSIDNNEFCLSDKVSAGQEHNYWHIESSMPEDQLYSIYAFDWEGDATGLTVGFDAGEEEVNTVEFVGGHDVVIRTNSSKTTLTVNAELNTVKHYDQLGALNIIKVNTGSYHENGTVNYAEIGYGRIVLEKGSKVEEVHINKKDSASFDTVIIKNNGGNSELPERITRDAVTVTEETLVVKVESNGSSENVYVYADGATGTKGSTQKITEGENKQNENVNSALGQLVLDNGAIPDKAQTAEEKAEAKDMAASEAVSVDFEKQEGNTDYVARIGQTGYMTLQSAVDAAVDGNNIALLKDIAFTSNDYVLVNKTVTLNLGANSITGSHDPLFVIGASVGKYNPTSGELTHTGHLTIRGEGSVTSSNWDMFCIFPDASLDIYGGTYTGFKASFYIYGGTLNTYGGDFTATSPNNTYVVQVKGAGTANIYAGNFTTPLNGGYGVYLDNASVSNFGSENGKGPTFNTWRACIASNGSQSHGVLANIYSGVYHAYRSDAATGENNVIQLANATSETQTLNVYGGSFEQTGSNENRCIFNVRYSGVINVNINGGKYAATSATRLFNGVGNATSGWPTAENVTLKVTHSAISTPQNVKVYNTSDVYQSDRGFNL